jgi:hypothetical protein
MRERVGRTSMAVEADVEKTRRGPDGGQRWANVDPKVVEVAQRQGGRGVGASAWHEPNGGRGGGQWGTGVDPTVVGEAVGEDLTTVEAWRQSRSGWARGWWWNGIDKVRVYGAAMRLKREIVATGDIVMSGRPSLLMISNDEHSDVSMLVATDMPIATDQSMSLLWLRSIATDFFKNRDLEQIYLFNILRNMIANDWEAIGLLCRLFFFLVDILVLILLGSHRSPMPNGLLFFSIIKSVGIPVYMKSPTPIPRAARDYSVKRHDAWSLNGQSSNGQWLHQHRQSLLWAQ